MALCCLVLALASFFKVALCWLERGKANRNRSCPAVSHSCSLTTVSLSISITFFAKKFAPTVDVVLAGVNWFLIYLSNRLVLPTPCAPRTTILASRDCAISSRVGFGEEKGLRLSSLRGAYMRRLCPALFASFPCFPAAAEMSHAYFTRLIICRMSYLVLETSKIQHNWSKSKILKERTCICTESKQMLLFGCENLGVMEMHSKTGRAESPRQMTR